MDGSPRVARPLSQIGPPVAVAKTFCCFEAVDEDGLCGLATDDLYPVELENRIVVLQVEPVWGGKKCKSLA